MKQFVFGLVATVLLLSGAPVQAVSLDSFTITDYDVEMTLGRDGEQRSTLDVTETITANFTQRNTNRGIERAFAKEYDGHPTDFQLQSVTNESGTELPYHWSGDTLRIGESDVYVYGEQTYVIEYSQRDVTKEYEDTGKAEWYWDVIGDEWRVPIAQASATIQVDESLRSAIQTDLQCYQGVRQSTDRCAVTGDDGEYQLAAANLGDGRGMTVALGFVPETFAVYQQPWWQQALAVLFVVFIAMMMVVTPIVLLIGGLMLYLRYRRYQDADVEARSILDRPKAPEYLPPPDASVLESAVVRGKSLNGRALSAQVIDWAVRHYIVIKQTGEKTWLKPAEYKLEAVKDFVDLSEPERKAAKRLWGHEPVVGSTLTSAAMKRRARTITLGLSSQTKAIKRGQFYTKNPQASRWFKTFSNWMFGLFVVFLLNAGFLFLGVISRGLSKTRYLNTRGAELKKYLDGLEYYIEIGEAERLKILQSPDGAETVGEAASDQGARVKLYERALPYAVLFGQEKDWAKALEQLYVDTDSSPNWDQTHDGVFEAAAFSSMLGGITSNVSQASSYSSSSSGGSSGGGFSGGGGGGGGGGGW